LYHERWHTLTELFHVYSDPGRDPRRHTLTVVYIGRAEGEPLADDDGADACIFTEATLPAPLAFDHRYRRTGGRRTADAPAASEP
jgi:8-oxo-dGTP diphosphatase